MNMGKLEIIYNEITNPSFFLFLKGIDIEQTLDLRDEEDFESTWMSNFHRLGIESFSADDTKSIDILREKSFKLAFSASESSELASYISDDIELIAKDYLLGNMDYWPISFLWQSYLDGKVPQ